MLKKLNFIQFSIFTTLLFVDVHAQDFGPQFPPVYNPYYPPYGTNQFYEQGAPLYGYGYYNPYGYGYGYDPCGSPFGPGGQYAYLKCVAQLNINLYGRPWK